MLWCRFTDESMKQLKVAYNRIFRIVMGLEHRTSMSAEFIVRNMGPFIAYDTASCCQPRECFVIKATCWKGVGGAIKSNSSRQPV